MVSRGVNEHEFCSFVRSFRGNFYWRRTFVRLFGNFPRTNEQEHPYVRSRLKNSNIRKNFEHTNNFSVFAIFKIISCKFRVSQFYLSLEPMFTYNERSSKKIFPRTNKRTNLKIFFFCSFVFVDTSNGIDMRQRWQNASQKVIRLTCFMWI